jgi:hypothetical protein
VTITEIAPIVIAAVVMLNGWLLYRSETGRKDRENIRNTADLDRRDFHDFKEKSAKEHVTMDMLSKVEERVISAIDRLADRLDRLFEGRK